MCPRLLFPASLFLIACSSSSGPEPIRASGDRAVSPPLGEREADAAAPPQLPDSAVSDPKEPSSKPVDPYASTLEVYAIHAPTSQLNATGLMWTTPGGLSRQVLLNEAGSAVLDFRHSIGHATVKLDCAAAAGRANDHFYGGMTTANDEDLRNLVLTTQVGLGVMFETVAGRFNTEAEVQADIDYAIQHGGTNFIRFGIDTLTCQRLVDYAREYQKRGIDQRYGLAVRPLYQEGAGCSAFAVSFLELANLLEADHRAGWMFKVRVPSFTDPWIGSPEPLIGGSRNPGVKIPVTRVASLTRAWATPQEPGIDIEGWDPTLMTDWIDAAIDKALADGSEKVEVNGKLRGLVLDRSTVKATPDLVNQTFFR